RSLGLSELKPFVPEERIIEYRLQDAALHPLAGKTVRQFVDESASESVAPGGGSTAALAGALGAARGTMVAHLAAHKRGWEARRGPRGLAQRAHQHRRDKGHRGPRADPRGGGPAGAGGGGAGSGDPRRRRAAARLVVSPLGRSGRAPSALGGRRCIRSPGTATA